MRSFKLSSAIHFLLLLFVRGLAVVVLVQNKGRNFDNSTRYQDEDWKIRIFEDLCFGNLLSLVHCHTADGSKFLFKLRRPILHRLSHTACCSTRIFLSKKHRSLFLTQTAQTVTWIVFLFLVSREKHSRGLFWFVCFRMSRRGAERVPDSRSATCRLVLGLLSTTGTLLLDCVCRRRSS